MSRIMGNLRRQSKNIVAVFLCTAMVGVPAHQVFASSSPLTAFQSLSAEADPHTGSANMSVPISVPSGRGGIQPNVVLQYNSSLPETLLSAGWTLELGTIQRSNKMGVPKYDSTDIFILKQAGSGQELVSVDGTIYRSQIEGSFMKIEFINGSYWRVTDKSGVEYTFGETSASREFDPADPSKVYQWKVDRVEDLHGNYMTFEYEREWDRLYPSRISYTGNSQTSLLPFAEVVFNYISRQVTPVRRYDTGYPMANNMQMTDIEVKVDGQLQRKYVLAYTESPRTGRDLLTRIEQFGADGQTSLPPIDLFYIDEAVGYTMDPTQQSGMRYAGDFNGDGRIDLLSWDYSNGVVKVSLSNGQTFLPEETWHPYYINDEPAIYLGDFNGDGMTDLSSRGTNTWHVALSDGTQFVNHSNWISGFGFNGEPGLVGDINGDGLVDAIRTYINGGVRYAQVALSRGDYFQEVPNLSIRLGQYDGEILLNGDFNGDGLMDFVTYKESTSNWSVRINPGILDTMDWIVWGNHPTGTDRIPLVADFNMDGMTDIGSWDYSTGKVFYMLSAGTNGFYPLQELPFTFSSRSSLARAQAGDFDGDAVPDYASFDNSGLLEIAYSDGHTPDLLETVSNNTGGTRAFSYTCSSHFNHTYLPFPVQLVESVTISNSLGDEYTVEYHYMDGYWDKNEREFRGFGEVKTTDPDGNYSITNFHQEDEYAGRIRLQSSYDAQGNLFSKIENSWTAESLGPESDFVYLARKDNYVYDGDAGGRRTAEEYFYEETPQMGNLTRVVQLGEVDLTTGGDIGTDSRTIETVYNNNTSTAYLSGLVKHTLIKDHAGDTVRQSWFYYDDQGIDTPPVKGMLTKKEDWGGVGETNPETTYTYTATGNLESTTDSRTNTTTIAYDPAYQVFPLSTTNALGHQVTNEYYGVNGVPLDSGDGYAGLWGQMKSTTDPNQEVGKRTYDTFGRLTASVSPLDSITYPTVVKEYTLAADYARIKTRQRLAHGQAQTIDTVQFYDGLGRLIQTNSKSEDPTKIIVSGQTEYDFRGLPSKKYLPYFKTAALDDLTGIDPAKPYASLSYDAMGRVVQTTNPDGTYSTAIYDDWKTETINENGHKQASYFDAYGRLIKKEEYSGADGRFPSVYPSDPYAVYATTLYEYDSEGNLVKTTDDHGNITTIAYDKLGRKVSMDDPDMGVWQYEYDLNGNLISQTDAKGQEITFDYDVLNRLINKTDGVDLNVNYTYDDVSVSHSKGRLTKSQYDVYDNTQFEYDALGREVKSTKFIDQYQYDVERTYDALDRIMSVDYPDDTRVNYEYNEGGQIEKVTQEQVGQQGALRGQFPEHRLFDNRKIIIASAPEGNFWQDKVLGFVGRALDVLLGVQDAYADPIDLGAGLIGYWKFDEVAGNMAVDSSGNAHDAQIFGTSYDHVSGKFDNALQMPGGSGHYALDSDGENYINGLTAFTISVWVKSDVIGTDKGFILGRDPNGADGTFALRYDAEGAGGGGTNVIKAGVQASDWQTYESASGKQTTQWQHIVVTWSSGNPLAMYIDGQLDTPTYNRPGFSGSVNGATKLYLGRGAKDDASSWDGLMDDFRIYNRVLSEAEITALFEGSPEINPPVLNTADAGDAEVDLGWGSVVGATGYKVRYGTSSGNYSQVIDAGNVINYTVDGLANDTEYFFVVTAYDGVHESYYSNELSATPEASAVLTDLVVDVDYNAAGQVTRIEYGNGTVTTFDYDPLTLRLSNKQTVNAAQETLQDLSYTYDAAGNIINITDAVNTATQSFEYDHLSRLVEAQGAQYGTRSYQYDEIGNLLEKDGVFYTYGENGAGPHAVTSLSSGVSFFYDANGNMIAKQIAGGDLYEYEYDVENRLIEVLKNSSPISDYEYDGDGGRTKKTVYGGTTDVTRYVGAIFEIFGAKETAHFHLGDMHIAALSDGEVNFFHHDHLGGANIITDAAGVKKELIEYLPYGAFSRHEKYGAGEDVIDHYFTGQRFDKESDLYYYNARYYDPELGRFISPDTIVQGPANPQTFNRYTYVNNNPVNNVDPSGHGWFSKLWKKVSGIIGTAVGTAVGIITGNPALGVATYSAIAASGANNFAQSFGANLAGGLVGMGLGKAVGSFWGGEFTAGLAASASGGAAAGALGTAILGGDPGLGALAGLAGGAIGYAGGYVWPLGADAIAGGTASVIQGGEFGDGAANGAYYNLASTAGGLLAPMQTLGEQQESVQPGDTIYFKPGKGDLIGAFVSFFEGGPFAHVGTVVDKNYMASADPAHGTTLQEWRKYGQRQAYINRRFEGNQRVIAAARALAVSNRSYGFIGNQRVCSTTCASAFNQAGYRGWYGVGPNSQASVLGYSQYRTTRMYGE